MSILLRPIPKGFIVAKHSPLVVQFKQTLPLLEKSARVTMWEPACLIYSVSCQGSTWFNWTERRKWRSWSSGEKLVFQQANGNWKLLKATVSDWGVSHVSPRGPVASKGHQDKPEKLARGWVNLMTPVLSLRRLFESPCLLCVDLFVPAAHTLRGLFTTQQTIAW